MGFMIAAIVFVAVVAFLTWAIYETIDDKNEYASEPHKCANCDRELNDDMTCDWCTDDPTYQNPGIIKPPNSGTPTSKGDGSAGEEWSQKPQDEQGPYPFPKPPENPLPPAAEDPDDAKKKGGGDPITRGNWWYSENKEAYCKPNNSASFDYDNDSHPEWFCYQLIGELFVIDFDNNGKIEHGYETLNFYRTQYEYLTPFDFLDKYPDVCEIYTCYWWKDQNLDWQSQEGELIQTHLEIESYYNIEQIEGEKCTYHTNNRCIYGIASSNDGELYQIKPTYMASILHN